MKIDIPSDFFFTFVSGVVRASRIIRSECTIVNLNHARQEPSATSWDFFVASRARERPALSKGIQ